MVCEIEVLECLLQSRFIDGVYIKRSELIRFLEEVTNTKFDNIKIVLERMMLSNQLSYKKLKKRGIKATYISLSKRMMEKFINNQGNNPSFYKTIGYEMALEAMRRCGSKRNISRSEDLIMRFTKDVKTEAELNEIIRIAIQKRENKKSYNLSKHTHI